MIATLADLGTAALLLALALSIYAAGAAFMGVRRNRENLVASAKSTTLVVFGLLTLAVGLMEYFLLTHQFEIEYVAH